MPGNLFAVCVPTADYEKQIVAGTNVVVPPPEIFGPPHKRGPAPIPVPLRSRPVPHGPQTDDPVSMEKVLEELLKKLEVEHIVWCNDKHSHYYQVFFPVEGGVPTENCLHCLTELGIGKKHNSVVSVLPCSVFFQNFENEDGSEEDTAQKKAWKNFVESIRSKLTVKQVVDGVRSGAECSFDYLTLILTADMVAAIGLVESSSVNIVAAMLISPLMGPVMAITFGAIIADFKLLKIGLRSEFVGILVSVCFGYIFGCLCGCTEMPWGYGDWPTEEMKARGMTRTLWIGILYALPSGTGVALALLQGSAGPLIGVAISASLLPPSVNCGIMWGLATIVHIYDYKQIPYIKGEPYGGNRSSHVPMYSDWRPNELAAMGIISLCLTLINIVCIFCTAIVVLKVKEVAAPYISTPDLRRFWEHDIKLARETNRTTVRHGGPFKGYQNKEMLRELKNVPPDELEETLEAAVREAVDDDTFRKVKRCSYAHHSADVIESLGIGSKGGSGTSSRPGGGEAGTSPLNDASSIDQVIQALMVYQKQQQQILARSGSKRRMHPLSRSMRHGSTRSTGGRRSVRSSWLLPRLSELGSQEQAEEAQEYFGLRE